MKLTIKIILLFQIPFLFISGQSLKRTADVIAANNCKMWVINNGWESHNAEIDSAGFYWMDGGDKRKHTIYLSGLLFGGMKNGSLSIGGIDYERSTYFSGVYGLSPEANDSLGRIWKIKKNWETLPAGEEKSYLEFNYNNWPGNFGAPFEDVDGDGAFTNGIDNPEFLGDEVIFYPIYSSAETNNLYDDDKNHSAIQINITIWASRKNKLLDDAVFEKIELINKDTDTLHNFYASYWVDADLGYEVDDYAGCDSILFMGYVWNSFIDDPYYGEIAPAVGHVVLSGFKSGANNLMMSAFGPNFKVSSSSFDPRNSVEHYNVIRGLLTTGAPFIDPYNNTATLYPLAGDPETISGWYEGANWPSSDTFGNHPPYPGDRRYYIISGPVNFSPGDTQSITFAHVVALGTSNLNSITELKNKAYKIHKLWGNDFISSVDSKTEAPLDFRLEPNYPNPFNPSTTIRYSIPSVNGQINISQFVSLKIFDVLGREVAELVSESQSPGNYSVNFNASSLSSGIYFYRISTHGKSITKKMILIR